MDLFVRREKGPTPPRRKAHGSYTAPCIAFSLSPGSLRGMDGEVRVEPMRFICLWGCPLGAQKAKVSSLRLWFDLRGATFYIRRESLRAA